MTRARRATACRWATCRSYLAVPVRSRSGQVLGGLFFGHPLIVKRNVRFAQGGRKRLGVRQVFYGALRIPKSSAVTNLIESVVPPHLQDE